ncbi:hypothetical protein [Actinoallomurus sp. CA-150999]|uniref:hypothetical protein n=1 Tax=Actinoallomurus sp. CA-150999 TaxID=3239887 RepID=UPI003D90BE85
MGIDRTSGNADEPDNVDEGGDPPSQPEHRPPSDRSGEPGRPYSADAHRAAINASGKPVESAAEATDESNGANDGPSTAETAQEREQGSEGRGSPSRDGSKESDGTGAMPDSDHRQDDAHKPPDTGTHASPLEQKPSSGDFSNLAEELDARAKSRELSQQDNGAIKDSASASGPKHELASSKLDDESIKKQIDPFAPDRDKAEGRKDSSQQAARDKDAEWTDGVDSFNDLPAGDKLADADDGEKPKGKNFRASLFEHYDDAEDAVKEYTSTTADFFGPRPTGHAETQVDSGPVASDAQHSGIDPGSAASSLLALGIVGTELFRWGREKIKERNDNEGYG